MPWEEKLGIGVATAVGAALAAGAVADSVQPLPSQKPKLTTPEPILTVTVPVEVTPVPVTVARLYGGGHDKGTGSASPAMLCQVALGCIGAILFFACGVLGVGFIHYKTTQKKRSTPIQIRACILSGEPDHPVWARGKAPGTEVWPLLG